MGGLYPSWGVPRALLVLLVRLQLVLGGDWVPNGGIATAMGPMVGLGGINPETPPWGWARSMSQGTGTGHGGHNPPLVLVLVLVLVPDSFGLFLNNQLRIKVQNL